MDSDGEYNLCLEIQDGLLIGTGDKAFTSGQCDGSDVHIEFEGTGLASSCGSRGGPFDGYWNTTPTVTTNTCKGLSPSFDCTEIFQFGDVVILDGEIGTASGNTATFRTEYEFPKEDTRWVILTTLQAAGDGSSLSGTWTFITESISTSEESCRIEATVSATPASPCPQFQGGGESRGLGFGLIPDRAP